MSTMPQISTPGFKTASLLPSYGEAGNILDTNKNSASPCLINPTSTASLIAPGLLVKLVNPTTDTNIMVVDVVQSQTDEPFGILVGNYYKDRANPGEPLAVMPLGAMSVKISLSISPTATPGSKLYYDFANHIYTQTSGATTTTDPVAIVANRIGGAEACYTIVKGIGGTPVVVPPHDQLTQISTGNITDETGTNDGKKYHLTDAGIAKINQMFEQADQTFAAVNGVVIEPNFEATYLQVNQLHISGNITIPATVKAGDTVIKTGLGAQGITFAGSTYFSGQLGSAIVSDEIPMFYIDKADLDIKAFQDWTNTGQPGPFLVNINRVVLLKIA